MWAGDQYGSITGLGVCPQAPVAERQLVLPPVNEGAPPFMPSWEDRYEEAHRHVTNGLYAGAF